MPAAPIDLKLQFEWRRGVWVAPVETSYGIVEVMVGGTEKAPSQLQLAALDPFFPRASEITERTRKKLRLAFLYRLIRVTVNDRGKVGLQFRNRITGAQPLLFPHE